MAADTPVVTGTAARLLRLLSQRAGHYTIEEIAADVRVSKSAVRAALAELEDAGLIQIDEED